MGMTFGTVYYVNNYTNEWPSIESILNIGNTPINKTTKPILKINLPDSQSPKLEFVSATEYTKGDGNGSTIIKLIDWRGNKINTTCYEKVLYPNKTTYIDWTIMTQHWEYGNYYMDFIVPEALGIYDQEVRCEISNKNISIGKGFHVSNISNVVTSSVQELRVDRMSVMS